MIIKSIESVLSEKIDALERIDKYLLILVVFKNGLIFGNKFNERQSKPGQWLMEINSNAMVGGIGDLHNFESAMLMLSDLCQGWSGLIGQHYLTGCGIKNFLAGLLHKNFEENATALAVNFIVCDCRDKNDPFLWFIDYDGSIKQLKNFAVAGGSEYKNLLTEEEVEKLSPEEKTVLNAQKKRLEKMGISEGFPFAPSRVRRPRKETIAYLEKNWKPNMKKEKAINLVKGTLFKCNPDSRDKMIEVVVIEHGKKGGEPFYFQKDKNNKNKK